VTVGNWRTSVQVRTAQENFQLVSKLYSAGELAGDSQPYSFNYNICVRNSNESSSPLYETYLSGGCTRTSDMEAPPLRGNVDGDRKSINVYIKRCVCCNIIIQIFDHVACCSSTSVHDVHGRGFPLSQPNPEGLLED
ncbi:hypothetical protein L9F63_021152, partial [Diploptera punctata]